MNLHIRYLHDQKTPQYLVLSKIKHGIAIKELQAIGQHMVHVNGHSRAQLAGEYCFVEQDIALLCDTAAKTIEVKGGKTWDCKFTGCHLNIVCNPDAVYIAVYNFCKNAMGYGDYGARVSASLENDFAVISVVDKGQGISKCWTDATQSSGEDKIEFICRGMGLTIARDAIVSIHGGRIEFGRGTEAPYTGTDARIYIPRGLKATAPELQ